MPASPDLFPLLELEDGTQRGPPSNLLPDAVLPLEDVERAVRHLDGLFSRPDRGSRTAPSIPPPDPPFTRQELLASSPQTAVGPPPASITITSPGVARSIASIGFAQSPFARFTVG